MCNPAMLGIGITGGTAILGAQQQQQEAQYNKGIAEYNARVQENEAQKIREAGVEAENAQRQRTAQFLGTQRAQLASRGIELTSGTPLQLQEDTVALGEMDALRIRSNFEDQAEAEETRARLTRAGGTLAQEAGQAGARATLLQGAGQIAGVASKWYTPSSTAAQGPTVAGYAPTYVPGGPAIA